MSYVRCYKRPLWGICAVIFLSALVLYACTRLTEQIQKKEPSAVPPGVQAPGQAAEVQKAPPPVPQQFMEPGELPQPGPPFNVRNSDGDALLKNFPRDAVGAVDWVKSFKDPSKINPEGGPWILPRESHTELNKPQIPPFPFDVEIPAIGAMPNVIFPHAPHTFWLDCSNCHPAIFIMKKGSNPISMVKIVAGEFCGRCHGRVAFPISNCTRCHVKPKTS